MNRFRYIMVALLALGGSVGCTTPGAKVESWVRAQGGIDTDPGRQARVNRVAKWFGPELRGAPLRVRVLAAGEVGAYGWRSGELFVTRGLAELLDDQELAAALAHEMGHMLGVGSGRSFAGLSGGGGDNASLTVEAGADRVGIHLLLRHRIPRKAMARMLAKVARAAGLDGARQDALRRRIELLQLER